MGRLLRQEDSDIKARLVSEICSISTTIISCPHRRHLFDSHFIDWYRLLGVGEDAEIDVIRKRYRQLALQLHPDKNKHLKAETAFKLVSEAYTCLSDNDKRSAFNLERWKKFCVECNRIPHTSSKSPVNSYASKDKAWKTASWSRSLRNLSHIKERFREEARVIENCLNANAVSRKESPLVSPSESLPQNHHNTRKEYPVFNPSDYLFQGYPHLRSRINKKPEIFCHLHRENLFKFGQGRGINDLPIFENGPERGLYESKSTCVRS